MASDEEDALADKVADLLKLSYNRDLGPHTRHDAKTPGALDVDFAFDQADSPVAMEITSIRENARWSADAAAKQLQDDLRQEVDPSIEGAWLVDLDFSKDFRKLKPRLVNLINNNREITPNHYTSTELEGLSKVECQTFLAEHNELAQLGLRRLIRTDAPGTLRIAVHATPGPVATPLEGFTSELEKRIKDNASKLGEARLLDDARSRETHLVVQVWTFTSPDPSATPAPTLPPEVDWLWVVHVWPSPGPHGAPPTWSIRRDETSWQIHR